MNLIKISTGICLIGILSSCKQEAAVKATDTNNKYCLSPEFKSKIKIQEVNVEPVTESIHLMGDVEANPDKVVEYRSLVNGVVAYTHFSLGDKVEKGQILAALHSIELSSLDAQSASVDARMRVAERKLRSMEEMYEDGIASKKELLEVQGDWNMLRAEKRKLKADLNLYGANPDKGVFQIKAPASGIIVSKNMSTGMQIADEAELLFTIASLDNVWVMANVYASNLRNVQEGMKVQISTLSYPGEVFEGTISMIPQVMDKEEKVLKARIVIPNPDKKLKPGMLVDVMVLKQQSRQAVAIPEEALVFSDNENHVLVYKGDCDVTLRKVNILAKNGRTLYLENGLEPGESIITRNQLLIYEQIKNFQN